MIGTELAHYEIAAHPEPGGIGHPTPPVAYTPRVRAHEWIDRRSLALHAAVAAKLEAQPELLDIARANIRRWLLVNPAESLQEWARLLDTTPLPVLIELMRSSGETATRLRQSSPFAGLLTPQERQAILHDYESTSP